MTDEVDRQTHRWQSIRAVLVGILVGLVLTLITDAVLHRIGYFPPVGQWTPDGPLAVATAYRLVYGVLGSYVIARLAPNRPMMHSLLAGAIGVVVSTIGAVATWNKGFGAHWYPITLIVTALPTAWLGAKLRLL
jgi:hypothetical protein